MANEEEMTLPESTQENIRNYMETLSYVEGPGIGRLRLLNSDEQKTDLSDFMLKPISRGAYKEKLHDILNTE